MKLRHLSGCFFMKKNDENYNSLGRHLLASRAADAFACKFSSFFSRNPPCVVA